MEGQDSPRRHPTEVLEDTLHVSELDSDDLVTPLEVHFPGNEGPLGFGDKVSFFMFTVSHQSSYCTNLAHSLNPTSRIVLPIETPPLMFAQLGASS